MLFATVLARGMAANQVAAQGLIGAAVGSEDDDGVIVNAQVLQFLHCRTDDVVQVRHPAFQASAALWGNLQR
jgi:hypothetical protein